MKLSILIFFCLVNTVWTSPRGNNNENNGGKGGKGGKKPKNKFAKKVVNTITFMHIHPMTIMRITF